MKKGLKKVFALTSVLLMIFAAGCSDDGESSGKTGGTGAGGTTADNGMVGIDITIDGTIRCGFCGKEYQKMAAAEACEHYKCGICGTAYKSADGVLACADHVTVTFVDSSGSNENVVQTVKSGSKVNVPDWSVTGAELKWESDSENFADPAGVFEGEGSVSVTFTAKYIIVYSCEFCGKNYYVQEEAEGCVHYICNNEYCEKHESGYASREEADNCALKDGCPKYSVTCECGTVYLNDADKEACVHYTISFTDPDGTNEKVLQIVKEGKVPVVPAWTKTNYTLSWSAEIVAAAGDAEYTAVWTELPKCSNCGEHYATEAAAGNCEKQDGCPQFGKVNVWVAGDALPSWLSGISGSATSDSKKVPYAAKNYTNYMKIVKNTAITVTPVKTGNITLYLAANKDSTSADKIASAEFNGAALGSSYNLPAYKASNPAPYVIAVTEEMVGKPVVFKTSYETLWFAITLNE